MKHTVAILVLMAIGLMAVVFTVFDLRRASTDEISVQWGQVQLAQAEEVTQRIGEYLRTHSHGLLTLSSVVSGHYGDPKLMGADVRTYFDALEDPTVRAISVYNGTGTIIYSTSASAVGRNDATRDFFAWARQPLNNGRLFVSPILQTRAEGKTPPTFGSVLVTPLHDVTGRSEPFLGCLSVTIDLRPLLGLQGGHLDSADAAGHRWALNEDGVLLFHSEHPEMVGRTVRNRSRVCSQCHAPTADATAVILAKRRGTIAYGLSGQSEKLAAFAPIDFENARWIVVVTTPLDQITRFTRTAYSETLILVSVLVIGFVGGSTLLFRNYRLKVKAEEEAQHWRNQQALTDAARRSAQRHETIIETAHDVIWTLDTQGLFTFCNRRAEEFTGYAKSDWIGNSFAPLVPPEDLPVVQQVFAETLGGTSHAYEVRVRAKDGRVLTLAVNTVPLYDDQVVVGTVSFGRDITDQKRVEGALIASEVRYRRLFEAARDGILILDTETGMIVDVNPFLTELLGFSRETFLGMKLWDLGFFKDIIANQDSFEELQREAYVRYDDKPLETRDGRRIDVEFVSNVYQVDGRKVIQCNIRDITERKVAREALQRSEQYVRLLLDSIAEGFYGVDTQGNCIVVNRACLRMLGYDTEAELLGLHIHESIHHTRPDGTPYPKEECRMYEALRSGSIVANVDDEVFWRRDGTSFPVEYSSFPILRNGQLMGAVASFFDITERKQGKLEQAKLEAQLQQAQKMESVGRLAGGVAHDFNNMLGVILGHAELALAQVDPTQPLHADLRQIQNAALRSADLTRQLLAFARKQTIVPTLLDLNDIVGGMLTMLQRLVGEDIGLKWQSGADLWPVKVDPSQIDQVLANLCVNARDAISGVGTIAIETGNSTIDGDHGAAHAGRVPGEYVRIGVSDDGCGMDAATVEHIFEPFFTTKGVGEGTGLGLATVYGIVKQNNGFIDVYSEPGHGTTFTILLPRHVGEAGPTQTKKTTGPRVRGHETLLLVEDDLAILTLTLRMLNGLGYTVLAASTPGEGIRLAKEHPGEIQLLITDVIMPEMNGRMLAQKLLSVYPDLRYLFMSGYTADVIAHRGVLDEGAHFIQKPFSVDGLASKVREALDAQN